MSTLLSSRRCGQLRERRAQAERGRNGAPVPSNRIHARHGSLSSSRVLSGGFNGLRALALTIHKVHDGATRGSVAEASCGPTCTSSLQPSCEKSLLLLHFSHCVALVHRVPLKEHAICLTRWAKSSKFVPPPPPPPPHVWAFMGTCVIVHEQCACL